MAESAVKYVSKPTAIPGVELRILEGAEVEVPEAVIQLFLELARRFAKDKESIKAAEGLQKERREELIKYVEALPGLRGLRSAEDDFGLLMVYREKVEWDRTLLRASLGTAYGAHVSEELVATITVPEGVTTEEELRAGLIKLLTELKIPTDDIAKILKTEVELRIDTEKIEELVADGRLTLLAGTKEVDDDWAVEVEPLKKHQRQQRPKKAEAAGA